MEEAPAPAPDDDSNRVLVQRRPIPGVEKGTALWIILNRPKQTNALTVKLLGDLQRVLDTAVSEKDRVIVITGAGSAFCGGHDLYQIHETQGDKALYERIFARCSRFMLSISHRVAQPVIAAVNGLATGAGCQLVAACDLAIASEKARFATSGVKLGLFCATPSVPLSRNINRKRAFEMLATGDFIDAPKALEWGLVNDVVEHVELEEAVNRLVEKIARKPAVALSMGKRFFYSQSEKPLMAAYDHADYTMANNCCERDAEEGIAAFVEKRHPDWKL